MTVLTKPLNKKLDESKEALIEPEVHSATNANEPPIIKIKNGDLESGVGRPTVAPPAANQRPRRQKMMPCSHCLVLGALFVALVVALMGAIQVLRQMSRPRYFRGRCGVPIGQFLEDSMISGHLTENSRFLSVSPGFPGFSRETDRYDSPGYFVFGQPKAMSSSGRRADEAHAATGLDAVFEPELTGESLTMTERVNKNGNLEFDFVLDLDYEEVETFELPEISHGRYMHDFKQKKTAIVDPDSNRCFVMPLDQDEIPRPRNLFDMLHKMRDGEYQPDITEIKHDTRVVLPPLDSLEGYGNYIKQECGDKTTFRLEKATNLIVKRSIEEPKAIKAPVYAEFTGKAVIKYNIVNLNELD